MWHRFMVVTSGTIANGKNLWGWKIKFVEISFFLRIFFIFEVGVLETKIFEEFGRNVLTVWIEELEILLNSFL